MHERSLNFAGAVRQCRHGLSNRRSEVVSSHLILCYLSQRDRCSRLIKLSVLPRHKTHSNSNDASFNYFSEHFSKIHPIQPLNAEFLKIKMTITTSALRDFSLKEFLLKLILNLFLFAGIEVFYFKNKWRLADTFCLIVFFSNSLILLEIVLLCIFIKQSL